MGNGPITTVSAMVMIASASGATPDPRHPPTAATLESHRPDPVALDRAQRSFGAAGFEVGHVAGGTFAITASATLFERYFGVELRPDGRGGVVIGQGGTYEMPPDRIPPSLRDAVAFVTFTPPPEFGPGNP